MQLHPPIVQTVAERHESELPTRDGLPRWRRYPRAWMAAGLVALLLLLVPPLINGNRYQRQIARSMSLSLGRPVHLDNVSLHLLPVPGLTLSNLVVSEDPAFGSEPTIRANTVEATLRLSSLWRRRVEFSTVRFVEPSVNLVRNAQGRWNLADVLLHASHVTTAPTVQRRAGPAPRFPYIEATGGRVNLKLGEEKLPYALTDADFALWQPSPHQWRVRLRGQPDRTDANMTEPGVVRVEGDLVQATAQQEVHVDLRANWHDAPLGQASLLLLGSDLGWRGSMNLEASLAGTLDQAHVASQLTLGGLRRAEFAPSHPLDLQLSCEAGLAIETVSVRKLACTLPDSAPQPLTITSPELNLQHPDQASVTVDATAIPSRWALLWAALFSPRVSTERDPGAKLSLRLIHGEQTSGIAASNPEARRSAAENVAARRGKPSALGGSAQASPSGGQEGNPNAWTGFVRIDWPSSAQQEPGQPGASVEATSSQGTSLFFGAASGQAPAGGSAPDRNLLRLDPVTVHPDDASSLLVTATVATGGYSFSATGLADRTALLAPARSLPQLSDGLEALLPSGDTADRVDFTCSASWGSAQVCAEAHVSPARARSR